MANSSSIVNAIAAAIAATIGPGYPRVVMPNVRLPESGRPQVVVEPDGENSVLDIDPALIVELYKAHGALLLRGFGADVPIFRAFAEQFCSTSVVNESPGRSPMDAESKVHTVDGGVGAFNLHPELSREPWKPDAAFFACMSPPSRGGATTICDGVALARELPAELCQGLEGRRLLYIKPTWPALLDYWLGTHDPSDAQLRSPPTSCPYFFRRLPEGHIVRVFSRPALHKPMFSDKLAFGNFLLFARFNLGKFNHPVLDDGHPVAEAWLEAIKATGDRLTVEVRWQAGDILMLDNTRFMHGRTAISDAEERLIATYFGYVSFALPDPEEPPDPIWRRVDFEPPLRPDHPRSRDVAT